jgi:hypothetical protein
MLQTKLKEVSPDVIRKHVLNSSLKNPIMKTTLVLGLLSAGVGFFVVGIVCSILVLGVSLGIMGIIFSLSYWGFRDNIKQDYLEELQKKITEQKNKKLKELKSDLDYCLKFTGKDKYVVQARKQYDDINNKFSSFEKLLVKKFNPNELTFARFMETAEQTYGAILDNLETIVLSFIALKDVDLDYLENRYEELKKVINSKQSENFDLEEFQAIQTRIDSREQKFYEVDEILSKNEKALTELQNLSFQLSSVKTYEGRAKQDIDKTLQELLNLIQSVHKYKIN